MSVISGAKAICSIHVLVIRSFSVVLSSTKVGANLLSTSHNFVLSPVLWIYRDKFAAYSSKLFMI